MGNNTLLENLEAGRVTHARFSKQWLLESLRIWKEIRELQYGFNEDTGWEQVKGKGEEINREYGQYVAICDFLDHVQFSFPG